MSRLVVVSNRVPAPAGTSCSGGLAVALEASLKERGGIWVGWSGRLTEEPRAQASLTAGAGYGLATIDLSPSEFDGYYLRCANQSLWPLLHNRVDLARNDRRSYSLYRKVNRRFAEALRPILNDDDLIWVNDYHLFPLGEELRRLGVSGPMGFFLHTPFPPPEIVDALPWHRRLLEQLCAYDFVGFQTRGSHRNFRDSLEQYRGRGEAGTGIKTPRRWPVSKHYPISIDTREFARLAASPKVQRWCRRLRGCMPDQTLAAGVERLDYTKGLPERLLAFEALLESSPDLQRRLSLVQIAAPSREDVAEYQDLQHRLDALSGRINARFRSFGWTPILYLNQSLNHTQLAALYRVARIGLVTPLRDGMNLVAKEYVAAQDPDDPGVLVLSRFAGAAEELTDALIVNPHDIEDMVRVLREALEMPAAERRRRWSRMMRHLEQNDVHRWRRCLLEELSGPLAGKGEALPSKALDRAGGTLTRTPPSVSEPSGGGERKGVPGSDRFE